MRTVGTEDLDRHWGVPPVGLKPPRPPISVVVGVISMTAAPVWIDALEAPIRPTLTAEFGGMGLLFTVALIVGTLLGVRILWGIAVVLMVPGCALVLSEAVQNPSAQSIGGLLLIATALVCLLWPSAKRFEIRRLRLVLV
jgi:hypothetical protein